MTALAASAAERLTFPDTPPQLIQAQLAISLPAALAAASGSLSHAGRRDLSLVLKTALTEALGGSLVRPWRLMGTRDQTATLLGYTDGQDASALRGRLAFATPAWQQAVQVVATAPLPTLTAGQRLRFSLRLVPTIKQTQGGEIDAFLYTVRQAPEASHDRAAVYLAYVAARLHGATIGSARLDGMHLTPLVRRQGKQDWSTRTFPVADLAGELTITDPHRFTWTLARGIGRQRGYGYGAIRLEAR